MSPYLLQLRENTDQKNSEYGHFLRSEKYVRVAVHQLHCYLEYMVFSKGEVNDTRSKNNFVKVRPNFTRKHVSI